MSRICLLLLFTLVAIGAVEKIRYVSTEHPTISHYSPKFMSYLNMTSQRYRRGDPFYYVGINFYALIAFGNNVSIHFYFFEFMTYRYERGFVELHFKFCDFIHKDKLFGAAMKQGKLAKPCPYPRGAYYLRNMTMSAKHIPRNFPFVKGRIVCNITLTGTDDVLASGYIDMEIKEARMSNKN